MALKELSAKHWRFNMLGEAPFTGLRKVSYSYTQEIEGIEALGEEQDYSFVEGNIKYEGELTFTESAYNRLLYKLPPGVKITALPPFDIIAQQVSRETGLRQKMSIRCKFKGAGKNIEVGGKVIEVTCPLYISDVIENLPL